MDIVQVFSGQSSVSALLECNSWLRFIDSVRGVDFVICFIPCTAYVQVRLPNDYVQNSFCGQLLVLGFACRIPLTMLRFLTEQLKPIAGNEPADLLQRSISSWSVCDMVLFVMPFISSKPVCNLQL